VNGNVKSTSTTTTSTTTTTTTTRDRGDRYGPIEWAQQVLYSSVTASASASIVMHTYIQTYIQVYIAPKSWHRSEAPTEMSVNKILAASVIVNRSPFDQASIPRQHTEHIEHIVSSNFFVANVTGKSPTCYEEVSDFRTIRRVKDGLACRLHVSNLLCVADSWSLANDGRQTDNSPPAANVTGKSLTSS